ncbi:hypothetical protein GGR57DRAFT_503556 [Xylariaceae sp. FL1272]|nr:hypothetical protein GGR57DRAFT_503556 [Xylariaceae sp. FL1272]
MSQHFNCECGRSLKSGQALTQHRHDKHNGPFVPPTVPQRSSASGASRASKASPAQDRRDSWMWKNVKMTRPPRVISVADVEPSPISVSSDAVDKLVCTYNWQDSKEATIQIPGFAPIWTPVTLPVALPPDKGIYYIDQNGRRVPKYPFEPLFRAADTMNPQMRFDNVDVVINRNSLRKFLDLGGGPTKSNFRVNVAMVHDTMIVERCEKSTTRLIRGTSDFGWGHAFEKTFTKQPPRGIRSTQHYRVLQYNMGGLNCVVRFEVDGCYEPSDQPTVIDSDAFEQDVLVKLGSIAINGPSSTHSTTGSSSQTKSSPENSLKAMPQSTAAEIKTCSKPKPLHKFMPQLWFGRTPWLITGHHNQGTFHKVDIKDVQSEFAVWETRNQEKLKKMVTLLTQLRQTVQSIGSRRCVAIYEKERSQLAVFESTVNKGALPDDLISKFWGPAGSQVD